ncbi:AMP-binding protein [Kribbella sp. NPDC056861]|uniref:(2,3-dihydroxybenzoyl)adenylate synthase n=1 Tax=Kribbella sp. NPDC056861 TaxID=3154857 RepID=UPI00342C0616
MITVDGTPQWPAADADRYRRLGYWRDETLGSLLRGRAVQHPDRVALVDGDRRISYDRLDQDADRIAAGLLCRGLVPGDRIVVHLPNCAEFVTLLYGCFRAGVVPVLALPPHRSYEIDHLVELSGAKAYAGLAASLSAAQPATDRLFLVGDTGFSDDRTTSYVDLCGSPSGSFADLAGAADLAVLLLSGGTTGKPKLIARTHADYGYNLRASAEVCGLGEDTVYLAALPAAHNFALACPGILGTLWCGGTVVLAPDGAPDTVFPLIAREQVTVTALVPPLVHVWLEEVASTGAESLRSLRLLQVGGARLKNGVATRVEPVLGCRLQQVYGMAEGLLNFTRADDPVELVTGTQGRPLSEHDEIVIVGPDGEPTADGVAGELWVRGPYTPRGYFRAEAHNRTAYTVDGFYKTGDLVRRLPSGHLVVEGRLKDVVNRGGDKVPVEEIEELLLGHPGIHDVAVIGYPDELMGERTCAFVVTKGSRLGRRDVVGLLSGLGVAAYKTPDRVRVVAELPRTAVGKVDRSALASSLAVGEETR